MIVNAPAKINLALHIIGQRSDGYHQLESLVCFCDYGDEITLRIDDTSNDIALTIDGPFADELSSGEDNLIIKAAKLFLTKANIEAGLHIRLKKNLPIASGIGGGSADAAATLVALSKAFDLEDEIDLHALSLQLGSDIAMCLASRPLIAKGVGDEIELVEDFEPLHLLLVNPNIPVSTPQIFKHLTNKENAPLSALPKNHNWIEWLKIQRNDLQPPATLLEPEILTLLKAINQTDTLLSRMSGSGATCFGIYKDAKSLEKARTAILANHPDWWCVATKSIAPLQER